MPMATQDSAYTMYIWIVYIFRVYGHAVSRVQGIFAWDFNCVEIVQVDKYPVEISDGLPF